MDAFREHFRGELTNDELLKRIVERPAVVRYPPLYPRAAGLVLEVLRQHLGDDALRLELLSYRDPMGQRPSDNKRDIRTAAANLIIASSLAGDTDALVQARSALIGTLESDQTVSGLTKRVRVRAGLADYLLGYSLTLPLPRNARQLLSSAAN